MLPKRIPLSGTVGDDFFVRQQDDYSCGPASLATVAKIYGAEVAYEKIRELLNPDPATGTEPENITGLAKKILPFEGAGESSYAGGVAIANIAQEGEGARKEWSANFAAMGDNSFGRWLAYAEPKNPAPKSTPSAPRKPAP